MSDSTPKRKRHSNNNDSVRKRRAIDTDATQVKVTVRKTGSSYLRPVLANAPGLDLSSIAFDAYSKKASLDDHEQLLLHSSDHPRLDYTGVSEVDQPVQHLLGIFDPESNSLELVPTDAVTVRSTLWQETLDVHTENELRTNMQKREALGMEFGTKKAKKAIASKTVNAIGGSTVKGVEQATLSGIDTTSALPTKEERDDDVLKAKPIPMPNLDAEEPKDVYPLDVLIPPSDLRAVTVKEWQDTVSAGDAVEVSSRFVANRLQRVVERGDIPRLKALKYLYLMIEFANVLIGSRGGMKLPRKEMAEKLPGWTESAVDSMRRRFAQGYELNKWRYQRLMTHAAAISLYIDHYRTELSDLREDLRQETRIMAQYFHELGCKTRSPYESEYPELKIKNKVQAAQKKVAYLKVPLEFPKTRNPPRRR